MPGILYLVATPIGNLEDISFRAVRILRDDVSLIACEDTRTTQKLLQHYSIRKPLISYHEHNEASRAAEILQVLASGDSVALLSDAGTPLISDPGYRLVQGAVEAGVSVIPLPGACAAILALAASGLATDQFRFVGFLPPKATARRTALEELRSEPITVVAYESPHRILDSLADIATVFGDRPIALARELTKLHEEVLRGSAAEVRTILAARAAVKGEITLVIGRASKVLTEGDPLTALKQLESEGMGRMEAIKSVAKRFDLPKREVYRLAMELDNSLPDTRRD